MRNGSITLKNIDIKENHDPLVLAKENDLMIPNYSLSMFVVLRKSSKIAKYVFFENPEEFLSTYTKYILFYRKDDSSILYFTKKASDHIWSKSIPPVLISTNIDTKLREEN